MKNYTKTVIIILIFITVFFLSNTVYNSFFNKNYKHLQDRVVEVVEKQDYIDFKDIIQKDWDQMYILDLRQDIDTYSSIYNIDFSTMNLPYRDRRHYQLIIFYKDNKMITYGYLTKDRIIVEINAERDIPMLRDDSKFNVRTFNNYEYTHILYK